MGRKTLVGVVVLMDARRPFTDNDRHFLEWLRPAAASRLILLSKADKLSRAEQAQALARTRLALDNTALTSQVLLFSSKSGAGVTETRALLDGWLRNKKPPEKGT
jgi:GTP-binding protein